MASRIRLQLFGSFAATVAGTIARPLPLTALRQRALLSYLASQPSLSETRERLATLIWSDSGDERARQSLRQALSNLRRELGALDPLRADRKVVSLDPERIETDAREFEWLIRSDLPTELERAFELYQGAFLEGFSSGAEVLDEWVEAERNRLQTTLHGAIERYAAMPDAQQGVAMKVLKRVVAGNPSDQGTVLNVVKLMASVGGRQAALAHAEAFVSRLRNEFDEEPDASLKAVIGKLHERSAAVVRTPVQVAPILPPPARPAPDMGDLFENVPPRDLNFTGRVRTLATLHALLHDDVGSAMIYRAAVTGLGGIGKTSLVTEYTYRFKSEYAGVWWVHAAQRAPLVESLAALGAALDPRLASQTDREKAAVAGLRIISRMPKPFLLVYDNVESPDTLKGLLPPAEVKVLITTRWPDWGGGAIEVKLDVFDEAVAVEFLQKRAGRTDPLSAGSLAAALGHLPLALDHAAAYCKLTTLSFASYLERLDAHVRRTPRGTTYPTSIAGTFELAFETAAKQHAAAEIVLGIFSYLAPQRVPLSLLPVSVLSLEARADAIAALYSVSLVEPKTEESGATFVSVHPLVQAAMRLRNASLKRTRQSLELAARLVTEAFPQDALTDPRTWPVCAILLPHALALRDAAAASDVAPPLGSLLQRAANYLHIRGVYGLAEHLYREAIADEGRGGTASAARIDTIESELALLLSTLGRYDESEPLLRNAIANGERKLGGQHLEVARRMNNLAKLLSDTKRYAEAEPLLRQAIAIADDPERGNTACSLAWRNNLGILLNETGRNDEGEVLYLEALRLGEPSLGRDHHEVARTLNNLGRLLRDVDRLIEAEQHVRDALTIWAQTLGTTHAVYARGQENLAVIELMRGSVNRALLNAKAALQVHEATLGTNHFWTRDSARTCADAYGMLGFSGEAEALRIRYGL